MRDLSADGFVRVLPENPIKMIGDVAQAESQGIEEHAPLSKCWIDGRETPSDARGKCDYISTGFNVSERSPHRATQLQSRSKRLIINVSA